MTLPDPGRYDTQATIYKRTVSVDSSGRESDSYPTPGTALWVELRAIRGTELEEARKIQGRVTHKGRTRYTSELAFEDRILVDGVYYDILELTRPDRRADFMEFLAVESK